MLPEIDPELDAIQKMIEALKNLDAKSKSRAIGYIVERYGFTLDKNQFLKSNVFKSEEVTNQRPDFHKNIRSLKEEKNPESTVEMALIVAYYLTEYSPIEERKSSISSKDLKPYFKQANYVFPQSWKDVLPNAKKAGYVDSLGKGEYKLNSVGYNLVVHGLPRKSGLKANL